MSSKTLRAWQVQVSPDAAIHLYYRTLTHFSSQVVAEDFAKEICLSGWMMDASAFYVRVQGPDGRVTWAARSDQIDGGASERA